MPGGVDDDTIDEDVGSAVAGGLIGLRVVAMEPVRWVLVEVGGHVLDDHGLGMDSTRADIHEGCAFL